MILFVFFKTQIYFFAFDFGFFSSSFISLLKGRQTPPSNKSVKVVKNFNDFESGIQLSNFSEKTSNHFFKHIDSVFSNWVNINKSVNDNLFLKFKDF